MATSWWEYVGSLDDPFDKMSIREWSSFIFSRFSLARKEIDLLSSLAITAVIKAKNEAHQIADCIRSLESFATEIIVVDDHSTDNTKEIAEKLGARFILAKSKGRLINELDKIGFLAAASDWILRLDADERMTPGLSECL